MLKIWGDLSNIINFSTLTGYRKKFIVFVFSEHTQKNPLFPIFPITLSTLLRFGWWCQYHGIEGGIESIRMYIGAVCEWQQSLGYPDPRKEEAWVYQKFRRDVHKHLEVCNESKAKLKLTHELFQAVMKLLDVEDPQQLRNAVSYVILGYTAIRRGHLIPKGKGPLQSKHLVRWEHIKFIPNTTNPEIVIIMLESGKTRDAAKKDVFWTAIKACKDKTICPVYLLAKWYKLKFQDPSQFLLADKPGELPPLVAEWTRELRAALRIVAKNHGLSAEQFDEKNYSGISFRKFSLSALAKHVQPQILAAHADHKSVETTHRYYVTQSISERAEHTNLIASGFK